MDLDLKVWKELAIKKQMLMRTVTDLLGLDAEASEEDIEAGIKKGVQQIADSAAIIAKMESDHKLAIAELQEKLEETTRSLSAAEATIATLEANQESLQNSFNAAKEANAAEVQGLKSKLDAKTRELKAVNTILGDTPENAAKKMKALNKKKHDATESAKRAERDLKNVTKEKRALQQELDAEKAKNEKLLKDAEGEMPAGDETADENIPAENGKKAGKKVGKKETMAA